MKKNIFKFLIMFLIIFPVYFSISTKTIALQNDIEFREGKCVAPTMAFREVKKTSFGNDLECVMTFRYCPECVKSVEPDGTYTYIRFVSVTGTLYDVSDSENPKKIVERKVKVNFTYDKKSFVRIDNPEEDLDYHRIVLDDSKTTWALAQTCELLQGKSYCTISEMFTIYKQNFRTKKMEHVENGHVDIACTVDGDLLINSKTM